MSVGSKVRFQTQITSLKEGICKIYETKELSDVIFRVKGQHFKAHKLILGARSAEFARILLSPTVVPNEIIVDKESITPTGFEILLCFIYTDKIETENRRSIVEAYVAADYYGQKALLQKLKAKIESWNLTKEEVCELLDAGRNIPQLNEKCIAFIQSHANEIIDSPTFLDISFECLNTILDSGALNNVPVMKRMEKVMEWAARRHTEPVQYKLVREMLLSNNPSLLSKLRIETLSLEDFGTVVGKYKHLLTADEVVQFMLHYTIKDASQLPSWCSPIV